MCSEQRSTGGGLVPSVPSLVVSLLSNKTGCVGSSRIVSPSSLLSRGGHVRRSAIGSGGLK